MKKTLRTMGLCALAALAVVSCKKNEEKVATTSFQATITQPTSNAKTHIGNDNWLLWNTGDAIKVFDGNGTAATFTTNDNNAKVANFEGEIEASERYCAFYPAASASDASAGTVTLTLAATQTYKNGSFETNTYPMTATNNENNFAFSSPCGLLAIPVKGTGTLGSIELTSKTQNEMLAGTYAFNLADMSNEFTGNATTVTLDCEGGLTLSESEAATMVFVLPVGTLANGFTAVLKGTNGAELYRLETTNDNAIAADMIRDMPAVTVSGLPVNTTAATNVVYTTATLNGNCTAPVGMSVTEVGFYWGNATAMNNRVTATVGENFSYDLEGLEEGTEYAFQAFAKNGEQEYTGSVETFTTGVLVTVPTVTTAAATNVEPTTATVGGSITDDGGGTISAYGISYSTTDGFEGEDGTQVEGTDLSEGSFTVNLTGLTGMTTYYVRAYATNRAGTSYGDVTYFTTLEYVPEGAVSGKFTVNANGGQVRFAHGNLLYMGSAGDGNVNTNNAGAYWKFADNQWDMNWYDGHEIRKDREWLAWGTSGYAHGATYFHPWQWGGANSYYYAYGNNVKNLYDAKDDGTMQGQADYGYNAIRNGGDRENSGWRTPTIEEWVYVLDTRAASTINGTANARYAKAIVNGKNGLIIFPDTYVHPTGVTQPSGINTPSSNFSTNSYASDSWTAMENAGCVFLPATGYLNQQYNHNSGTYGTYWASTYRHDNNACRLIFDNTRLFSNSDWERRYCCSVRLVIDVE